MTFVGYTYKQNFSLERAPIVQALQELESNKPSQQRKTVFILNYNISKTH
jgi:hypothetical protein